MDGVISTFFILYSPPLKSILVEKPQCLCAWLVSVEIFGVYKPHSLKLLVLIGKFLVSYAHETDGKSREKSVSIFLSFTGVYLIGDHLHDRSKGSKLRAASTSAMATLIDFLSLVGYVGITELFFSSSSTWCIGHLVESGLKPRRPSF